MSKKAEVTKIRQAVVGYKDGEDDGEVRVVQRDDGFDISWDDMPSFVVHLTKVQWKAAKKAVKALKKGKKNRVVEEPEPEVPKTE